MWNNVSYASFVFLASVLCSFYIVVVNLWCDLRPTVFHMILHKSIHVLTDAKCAISKVIHQLFWSHFDLLCNNGKTWQVSSVKIYRFACVTSRNGFISFIWTIMYCISFFWTHLVSLIRIQWTIAYCRPTKICFSNFT